MILAKHFNLLILLTILNFLFCPLTRALIHKRSLWVFESIAILSGLIATI